MWCWFWGTIFVFLLVAPFYFVVVIFVWLQRLFALVVLLWKVSTNAIGFTIGVGQQLNLFADKFGKGEYKDVPLAVVNKIFANNTTPQEAKAIQEFSLDVANSVVGAVASGTTSQLALQTVVD